MLNEELQENLKMHFKPLKIVAFSNCCRWGCTGSYDEEDRTFEGRDKGIYFIRLHLNGMNYLANPKYCYAQYTDYHYLMDHWSEERNLLVQWCKVLGLLEGQFKIVKPESDIQAIQINFQQPLNLDKPTEDDDESTQDYEEDHESTQDDDET